MLSMLRSESGTTQGYLILPIHSFRIFLLSTEFYICSYFFDPLEDMIKLSPGFHDFNEREEKGGNREGERKINSDGLHSCSLISSHAWLFMIVFAKDSIFKTLL